MKTTSLAGSIPYQGPANFREICRAIVIDGKEKGYNMSYDFVYRVIRLFFSKALFHMFRTNFVTIPEFVDFGMTLKEKKRRLDIEEIKAKKRYTKKKKIYLKNAKIRMKKARMDKVNNYRAQSGMRPLTFKEYCCISKHKIPNKLKVEPKFNYTFDILDTRETSM